MSEQLQIRTTNSRRYVFDTWRRRWVRLTPEELVRQHLLHQLVDDYAYPQGLIAVETSIQINGMNKRCDAVVYNHQAQPLIIIECKAPDVELTQRVFDQAAVYNTQLRVPYLMVANGKQIIMCKVENGKYIFARQIPQYNDL